MQKVYFNEEQRFTQPWLWVILVVSLGVALIPLVAGLFVQIIQGKPYGENSSSDTTLLVIFFVVLAISIGLMGLFWKMRLITEIGSEGISVQFPPFFFKPRIYTPDTIESFKIRQYKPIREYGGWGIKQGVGKSGRAYNVKGNQGLQLILKNGRKLLIGTQRNDAILRAMNKMMEGEE